jgi:hypothetical protein
VLIRDRKAGFFWFQSNAKLGKILYKSIKSDLAAEAIAGKALFYLPLQEQYVDIISQYPEKKAMDTPRARFSSQFLISSKRRLTSH